MPLPHDRALRRHGRRIDDMLGHLKGWRRIAMRYDRCGHTFMPAICLARSLFWVNAS